MRKTLRRDAYRSNRPPADTCNVFPTEHKGIVNPQRPAHTTRNPTATRLSKDVGRRVPLAADGNEVDDISSIIIRGTVAGPSEMEKRDGI